MGTSAGGSLSLLMALTKDDDLPGDPSLAKYPARARCAVAWFGATDFTQKDLPQTCGAVKLALKVPILFKSPPGDDMHECEVVSPVWYMKRNALKPPMLLVHGDSDQTAPAAAIGLDAQRGREAGCAGDVHLCEKRRAWLAPVKGPISPTKDEINKLTLKFILENNR